jgi:hypothetical protein
MMGMFSKDAGRHREGVITPSLSSGTPHPIRARNHTLRARRPAGPHNVYQYICISMSTAYHALERPNGPSELAFSDTSSVTRPQTTFPSPHNLNW